MNPSVGVLIVVLVIAAAVGVALWLEERTLRAAEAHPAVRDAEHSDRVVLGGFDGPHVPRLHGNGVLALNADLLVFVSRGVPHQVVEIPVLQITKVDLTSALRLRRHWRRNRRHWLRVRWQTGEGVATMGVIVPDPARWAQNLSHLAPSDTTE